MAEQGAVRPRKYPFGIAVQAPPGWIPPLPAPPPPRPADAPFRTQVGLILRTMMLSLLVVVCMGVGWFLVNGRRSARADGRLAVAGPTRQDRTDPEPPKKAPVPPVEPPKQKEEQPPPKKKNNPPDPPKTKTKTPTGRELTYERDVLPILDDACLKCHGEKRKSAGLDLRTFRSLRKGGDSGVGVVPGDPEKSPLYDSVRSGSMPPGKQKLSAAQKETIRAWIAAGANSSATK